MVPAPTTPDSRHIHENFLRPENLQSLSLDRAPVFPRGLREHSVGSLQLRVSEPQKQKARFLPKRATRAKLTAYSRSKLSSITTLPLFSTEITLCRLLNPVRVMSIS